MRFDFMIVDVFTDRPFGGNQLAILTDARGLTSEAMQTITREFDFPETTFLLPSSDPASTRKVRIFTPGRELPFAGHPTVGTACALVMAGDAPAGEIVLEEGVGPVPVLVEQNGESFSGRFRLDQAPEMPGHDLTRSAIAAMLSLEEEAVADVFAAGLGVDFTFVQLADREAVDRATLDQSIWSRVLADRWGAQVYIFAGDLADGKEIYARMFGPKFGIAEDPATGSAAAALVGAAALRHLDRDSELWIDIRQGVKMGRPSLIRTSATIEDGALKAIHVGGGCAFVAQGQIEVPDELLEL
jgi:trans-2,3-dihydro-3-hydroxyanthranilate isomerase